MAGKCEAQLWVAENNWIYALGLLILGPDGEWERSSYKGIS